MRRTVVLTSLGGVNKLHVTFVVMAIDRNVVATEDVIVGGDQGNASFRKDMEWQG